MSDWYNGLSRFGDSENDKVRTEHHDDFLYVHYRRSTWCFNMKRDLTYDERLRLESFLEIERKQMMEGL